MYSRDGEVSSHPAAENQQVRSTPIPPGGALNAVLALNGAGIPDVPGRYRLANKRVRGTICAISITGSTGVTLRLERHRSQDSAGMFRPQVTQGLPGQDQLLRLFLHETLLSIRMLGIEPTTRSSATNHQAPTQRTKSIFWRRLRIDDYTVTNRPASGGLNCAL